MSICVHQPHRVHQSLLVGTAGLTTRLARAGLVTVAVLAAAPAGANPLGGSVVGGTATISGQGTNSVTINQSSQNTIINWATFNINQGQTTTFNQPNSNSVALNRVIGGQGPSFLDGTLTANGRVFIINGDGILFGAHSSITTAGFLATTNNIRDADFMAGKYNFNIPGAPDASIVNLGSITATSGGFAALVAPGVRNAGTITATLGTVSLAAGNAFTLDFYGDRLITLAVNDQIAAAVKDVQTGQTLKSLVSNSGTLSANGGRAQLTAAAARAVVDSVINNTGVIEANSVGTKNGMIVLRAATGATKGSGAPVQTVKLAGQISAAGKGKGTTGGTVVVSGENIVLWGAKIDASGDAGGGKVLIGGDTGGGHPTAATLELSKLESFLIPTATTVSVDGATVINASATGQGNGGKVVLWSDQKTTFAGTILAQGGASGGDGGFVETSGQTLDFTGGRVNTSAPMGKTGNWLLDPTDLLIDSAAASTISSNLTTTNVKVETNADGTTSGPGNTSIGPGDINVSSNINWASNNTLTLSAYRNVNLGEEVTISNTGAGNLIIRADNSGIGTGTVRFSGGQVDFSGSTGAVSIYYNPTGNTVCHVNCGKYQNSLDFYFNLNVTAHNTAYYMLVNNAADLQEIGTNLTGAYALGRSFDASSFGGFSSGTTFNGTLDGNGGLGVISTISNLTLIAPFEGDSYGLLPHIGSNGIVRNLNLANVNITAGADIQLIGALAGQNAGTISKVAVLSGTVDGGTYTGIGAGGLVGENTGTITGSTANVAVTVGDTNGTSQANFAGGLLASNLGTITSTSATGNVSGGASSYVGGFVGQNGVGSEGSEIFQSFATGAVTGGPGSVVGGFGALNIGSIKQVFAIGAVTGGANTVAGGLVAVNGATQATENVSGVVGSIVDAYSTGAVRGGTGSIAAGLVAVNDGMIETSYSAGAINGSSAGGLVAQNNSNFQFADLNIPSIVDLAPGAGTITNSFWNTQTSGQPSSAGGTGMTSVQLAAGLPAGFDPNVWIILPDPSFPYFPWAPVSTIPNVVLPPVSNPNPNPNLNPLPQIIDNLTGGLTLVSLPSPVNVLPYPKPPPVSSPQSQPAGAARLFAVPPPGEVRFLKDEVVLMVDCDTSQSALDAVARAMRLSILASQCLTQTHKNLLRMHINSDQTVAQVIRALARYQILALAQANFVYQLMQDKVAQELAQDPDLAGRTQEGDSAQYALGKLGLIDIHRQIKGTNIPIAIIDSQIDVRHPDLDGVFADQYDAVGGDVDKPHPHGTGMAGAIAAHRKLMGIAPAARLFAIHAFSSGAGSADSTTYNILKGLDWAASKGVRIINMSFAGPRDPSMERALKAAHDKGIVLIAAAGNAGPKSPPLFPGADPNVIAVTATDSNDKIFTGANRGRYIAVAAPGVDILVPAPDNTYQLTTGTSVSSAEVSGIVALLLERNPNLTPEDIRKILTTSARHPGTQQRDDDFGSGMVDPSKAIQDAGDLRSVSITGASPQPASAGSTSSPPVDPRRSQHR